MGQSHVKVQWHLFNPLDTSHRTRSLGLEEDPATLKLLFEEFRKQRGPFCSLWLNGRVSLINLAQSFHSAHNIWCDTVFLSQGFTSTFSFFSLQLQSSLAAPTFSALFFLYPSLLFFQVSPSLCSWSSLNCTSGPGAQFLQGKESRENFGTPCVGSTLSNTIFPLCLGDLFCWQFLSKELFCLHTKRTHSSWTPGYKLTQIWLIQTSNNYHCLKKSSSWIGKTWK